MTDKFFAFFFVAFFVLLFSSSFFFYVERNGSQFKATDIGWVFWLRMYANPQFYPGVKSIFTWRHGAILVFQNNETAAMLVYQDNPVGIELFSYENTFVCS